MKPTQAIALGAIAVAVVASAVLLRSRRLQPQQTCKKELQTAAPSECYLQRDDAAERSAANSARVVPDGALVLTKSHGAVTIVSYDASSQSYTVRMQGKADATSPKEQKHQVPASDLESVRVRDMFVYPIKSCRGVRLETATITERGILNDRTWMFTDEAGTFITQRRYHKMALIDPLLDDMENPTSITLRAEGMPDLVVPILREGDGQERPVRVWKSHLTAIDQGDAAAEWINTFLANERKDKTFRFVRMKESGHRPTNPKFAPDHETAFADGYPFLLTLNASIDAVNEALDEKIDMYRFRPKYVKARAFDLLHCAH
ncbi:hypothetical protein P43SY_003221 [Pythium insidiosum]|uniref:Molybdenum cofactor sulfurase middle domain-containing protein n=1 Tax=Pythium insidiosum TaxID=114742 RepID=A0AAD5QCD2_PYTIN|nr:hypothetical protein P43SY_003221 [Pythium insidiosum]